MRPDIVAAVTTRLLNFGSGPAMLPTPVLEQVRDEFLDLDGRGMSIVEMSHRSTRFAAIAERTEQRLRSLLEVPESYRVLFVQGGATLQFSAVPLNLAAEDMTASHLVTGHWSRRAAEEAARYCPVEVVADGGPGFETIADPETWRVRPDAAYLAYAANETIHGFEIPFVPLTGGVPVVADMSSTILSRPIDVSQFGVIYFGAQKNLGPAGLTVVVIRGDLLGRARGTTPTLLDYRAIAESGSMLNTPPTFAWYVAGLVLEWIAAEGGLSEMAERAERRAGLLYEAIDSSRLYRNNVDPRYRSRTNVPFGLVDPGLEPQFLEQAAAAGLIGLRGHRSVGGIRASLYNAMPQSGVDTLVEFMADFEERRAGLAEGERP